MTIQYGYESYDNAKNTKKQKQKNSHCISSSRFSSNLHYVWTDIMHLAYMGHVPMLIANLSLSPLTVSGQQKPFQYSSLSKVLRSYS